MVRFHLMDGLFHGSCVESADGGRVNVEGEETNESATVPSSSQTLSSLTKCWPPPGLL